MSDSGAQLREQIKSKLAGISSAQGIFDLFASLNYPNYPKGVLFDKSHTRKKDHFEFRKEDADNINEIYAVLSFGANKPNVFLIEAKALSDSFIKNVSKKFEDPGYKAILIFSKDYSLINFVFPRQEKAQDGSTKLRITRLVVEKDDIHYTDVETLASLLYKGEEPAKVWNAWEKAFSVKRVTKEFFEGYKRAFFSIRDELIRQKTGKKEAHEFTLQFLNRVMFLYFVSKKKWFDVPNVVQWLWTEYKKSVGKGKNQFYEKWLKQVFFKAFNNQTASISGLPAQVITILHEAPFLNGGLFKENDTDALKVEITDDLSEIVLKFFSNYNFTVREDMPLYEEVAVDPQMIGYVYESLAFVSDDIYDMNDLGIFYTPRIEVDFMCRRSLVEYLFKNLPELPKERFYQLVFDEDKEKIEAALTKEGAWRKIEDKLDTLAVIDPACGSGAFLVGMLNVLTELYRITYRNLNRSNRPDFGIKKGLIYHSLYGVDVMPWAIHAAELRLWLQLIVETPLSVEQRKQEPLLPNLDMNLRIGDSLVQEMGGLNFHVRANNLKPLLKNKLEALKQEKEKYAKNDSTRKYTTIQDIFKEEIVLFNEIIDEQMESLKNDNDLLLRSLNAKQTGMPGYESVKTQKMLQKDKEDRESVASNESEMVLLRQIKKELAKPEKKPFIWELDFAEIFSSDRQGFDIVIGNPPYVRQEKISPPNRLKDEVGLEDRKMYKNKLISSVQKLFPQAEPPAARSDLYLYFYFHGLSLLNPKGTFCFITSNSWLDVGYGAELQEFLLRRVPIHAIYDNQAKRSFEHAAVNTIIALFGAPLQAPMDFSEFEGCGKRVSTLDNIARFVMFKKPFEEALSTRNLLEIENAKQILRTDSYRLYPISQRALLEDGWEYPEDFDPAADQKFSKGHYAGNKWGGKYLRAPDIYFTILEKGKGKLVKLGDIAKIRFGIKTGVNDFFYLEPTGKPASNKGCLHVRNGADWEGEIEEEFLKPVIKSPRECDSILVDPKKLKYRIFMCHKAKADLKGTNALDYIEWGEKQKTDGGVHWNKVPSVSGRKNWYDVGSWDICQIVIPCGFGAIYRIFQNKRVYIDKRLYAGYVKETPSFIQSMNSTLFILMQEVNSRIGLGDGLLDLTVYEVQKTIILQPNLIKKMPLSTSRQIKNVFLEIGVNPSKPIREQEPKPLPDRKELDDVVFDALGLTKEERKEVYWAVCELVKQRLDKARSLESD